VTLGWRFAFALSIVSRRRRPVDSGFGIMERRYSDAPRLVPRSSAPITEVIKKQPDKSSFPRCCLCRSRSPFYIFTAFIFAMRSARFTCSRDLILTRATASVVSVGTIPASGPSPTGSGPQYLHDRGRPSAFLFLYFASSPRDPLAGSSAIVISLFRTTCSMAAARLSLSLHAAPALTNAARRSSTNSPPSGRRTVTV